LIKKNKHKIILYFWALSHQKPNTLTRSNSNAYIYMIVAANYSTLITSPDLSTNTIQIPFSLFFLCLYIFIANHTNLHKTEHSLLYKPNDTNLNSSTTYKIIIFSNSSRSFHSFFHKDTNPNFSLKKFKVWFWFI
jgi:hypothetical protein